MSGFRLVTLGVGNAFSARFYSTCFALEADGLWLLIDCPHPIRKMMREASLAGAGELDVDRLHAVVLTHLHADHVSGLEGLAFYSRFVLGWPVRLLAHPQVSEPLWDHHLAAGMKWGAQGPRAEAERRFEEFFTLVPLSDTRPVTVGPFSVECRLTRHSVPTTALRIAAGGRCLGYSADTAFDPELIAWLAAADLIVHEAGPGFLHTPYEDLAGLPVALRSKMRVVHYPDDFDDPRRALEPLRQGCCYEI